MEKTTLYLPVDLQARLRQAARHQGRPQADIVREALTRYLATSSRPRPRSAGIVSIGPGGGLDAATAKHWAREQRAADIERKVRGTRSARKRRADG